MGRSVDYLNHAETVIYFSDDWLSGYDDGVYDEYNASDNWEEFSLNLKAEITKKLKSYYPVDKYDGRETNVFLENNLCKIGISEYCGLYSLSVAPSDDILNYNYDKEGLAIYHAQQIKNTLIKILEGLGVDVLNRVGTFSNGNGAYEMYSRFGFNSKRS